MKPIRILDTLVLAYKAGKLGHQFNPLFTGDAGLGKSDVCKLFVEIMRSKGFPEHGIKPNPNYGFLDLRAAYMEAPDFIGFPESENDKNGVRRTVHNIPEFWPMDPDSEGLILLEEPNRATTGVMNCMMQLLTDNKVHKYELPKGWIKAGAINPDTAEYDVNAMDAALKNRFEEYEIEFDFVSFSDYIAKKNWDTTVQAFINSGAWVYKGTQQLADGAKYISPRTWSKVNAAEKAGLRSDRILHSETVRSILGKDIGNEYHKFCYDEAPVTAKDLLDDKKAALKRLEKQSDVNNYKGDMISVTVESITLNYSCQLKDKPSEGKVGEETMAEVAKIIPADQAINLIKNCGFKQSKGAITTFFKDFVKRNPELKDVLKASIRVGRGLEGNGQQSDS
jgi:hypothetical protein